MACYYPLSAFQCADGSVVFQERKRFDVVRSLSLPCGQCVGCRLERSRQWAMRCMHEASCWESNCFVTLTYDEENLPADGSLKYEDFQKFIRRLRKVTKRKMRFYMCGEYGDENGRPHFHACLFGFDFDDKVLFKNSSSGSKLYTSKLLERVWPFGLSSVGDVTFESAAYVARYCMKKVTGPDAKYHYRRYSTDVDSICMDMSTGEIYSHELTPEFNQPSLKPGIGATWLAKWGKDVYPHDYVIVNGKEVKPPKYYDKLFEASDPDAFEFLKFKRELDARSNYHDNTDSRLLVRERVTRARLSSLKRGFQ